MFKRTSYVDFLKINSAGISSVVQIGDSSYIHAFTRALAVQREAEIFFGNEGNFANYSIFTEPIPLPRITENVFLETNHVPSSGIKVDSIRILGVSASSVVHVGSSKVIQMEARVKHIRHLLKAGESQKKA
jgi:spore germination protein PE